MPTCCRIWSVSSVTRPAGKSRLLPLAFRRPVSEEDVTRYVGFMQRHLEKGYNFEAALRGLVDSDVED